MFETKLRVGSWRTFRCSILDTQYKTDLALVNIKV